MSWKLALLAVPTGLGGAGQISARHGVTHCPMDLAVLVGTPENLKDSKQTSTWISLTGNIF